MVFKAGSKAGSLGCDVAWDGVDFTPCIRDRCVDAEPAAHRQLIPGTSPTSAS